MSQPFRLPFLIRFSIRETGLVRPGQVKSYYMVLSDFFMIGGCSMYLLVDKNEDCFGCVNSSSILYVYYSSSRRERRLILPQAYCSLAAGLFRAPGVASTSSMLPLIGGFLMIYALSYSISGRERQVSSFWTHTHEL